jgi:4-amino-4-deoxy-L-arabinose transferase-like glycosyltransferase
VSAAAPAPQWRRAFLIALVPLALAWFGGLEYRGLFQPDEGRYAEIPREMLASGDWVTPRLNDLKYFEKPPLQYWATALALAAFGRDEWSARLWPAVSGFCCVLLVAFAGNRVGPPGSGFIAGLVLASCIGFFMAGQYLTLDMGLAFFLCAALCAFLLARREDSRAWMLLAWAAMAGAVLSKGLVGLVLPGAALLAHALVQRDASMLRRLEWIRGGALFALLTLPWHLLVQWRNPEFFRIYVLQEHLGRYFLPGHHRPGPWWYLAVILLLAMIPWAALLPGAVRRSVAARARDFDVERFLLVFAAVVLLFFSASSSKLPAYIIPAIPPLSLLLGRDIARRGALDAAWPGLLLALGGASALAFGLPAIAGSKMVGDPVYDYFPWFIAGTMLFAAGGLIAWGLRRGTGAGPALVLVFASIGGTQALLLGLHQLDAHYSTERLVEQMLGDDPEFRSSAPFYSVGYFDPSLPFYLDRTLTLVGYRGELGPGIAAEPGKYVASLPEFERRWRSASEAYAAMQPEQYAAFRAAGLPMRVLALDARRVIVARAHADPPPRK